MKAEVSLEFYCYIDAEGMMKYIRKPQDKQPGESSQEELALNAKEAVAEEDDKEQQAAKEASEAIEKALEEVGEAAPVEQTPDKHPLNLSSLEDGMYTGKKKKGQFTCTKEEMRDLLDAERDGLRPLFILSIK